MLNSRQNASDASSGPAEETVGLTTDDLAQLSAPSARKKYASPADWERHKEKIRQLYLDENQPLREVMAVMGRDDGHFGSIKQYKNKLREWEFDTKYKRHQTSRKRNARRPGRQSAAANRAQASRVNHHLSPAPNIEPADNRLPFVPDAEIVDTELSGAPDTIDAVDQLFQLADAAYSGFQLLQPANQGYSDYQLFQPADTGSVDYQLLRSADAGSCDYQLFEAADTVPSDYQMLQPASAGPSDFQLFQPADPGPSEYQLSQPIDAEASDHQPFEPADAARASTPGTTRQASADNQENWRRSPQVRNSLAVGIRSGRSATPPISIAERIFSLAQRHIETSFTYGVWKLDNKNVCTSMTCTSDEMDLPETYFDHVRSAVLLFQQGAITEGQHVVSKAFALVKPILKTRNVRALNFFWTSVVFLIQFDHANIVVSLIRYIYEMAKIVLHPEHPVVQMFRLLSRTNVLELEALVHNTWQITADAFQNQLPKLHPEYVRHQCDLIYRMYGTRDVAIAERRLQQLLKECEDTPQTPEMSHMTVLNALGYNFMNSKDWVQAVNIGQKLEERAQLAQDIDLLVYQIGGMEIQGRAFNELKLFMPAVKCMRQATPLIAKQWGVDDPWRIELMILQQTWLRENGEIKAADELKAEISSITERINAD